MGIYDRDYGREAYSPWENSSTPRSMTVTLIIINVFVFIAEQLTREITRLPDGSRIIDSVVIDWLANRWDGDMSVEGTTVTMTCVGGGNFHPSGGGSPRSLTVA